MAFTVNMTFVGRPTTVKWDQGQVEADPEVEYVLRARAEEIEDDGASIGPFGCSIDPTNWKDGLSFLALCMYVSEKEVTTTGEVPTALVVPEDAAS